MSLSNYFISLISIPLAVAFNSGEAAQHNSHPKCPSRKFQICDENGGFPRTVAERTSGYLSNGSAGNRHLQSIDGSFMDGHLDIPAPIIVSPRGSLLGPLNLSKTLPGPTATMLLRDPVSKKVHNFNCAGLNMAFAALLTGIKLERAAPFTDTEQIKDARGRLGCKSYEI